jgi:hypothetical protein
LRCLIGLDCRASGRLDLTGTPSDVTDVRDINAGGIFQGG